MDDNPTQHRRTCLLNFRIGICDPFVVSLLFFLRGYISASTLENNALRHTVSFLNHFFTSPLITSHSLSTNLENFVSTSLRASKMLALALNALPALKVHLWQVPKYMTTHRESPLWVSLRQHPLTPWQVSCAKSQWHGRLRCNRPGD